MNALLTATGVDVALQSKPILRDVEVVLERGCTTALLGPNGAGKSTLLRVLAAELAPSRGRVALEGTPLASFDARTLARRRAVVTQDTAVPFAFLVAEVVGLGTIPWGLAPAQAARIVERAARMADVAHLLERDVRTLSGGERQRVQLARALAQLLPGALEDQLLILDEPFSALDIGQTQRMLALVDELHGRGLTVLTVMHDMNAALQCAQRVVLLDAGRVCAAGDPSNLDLGGLLSTTFATPLTVHARHDRAPLVFPAAC